MWMRIGRHWCILVALTTLSIAVKAETPNTNQQQQQQGGDGAEGGGRLQQMMEMLTGKVDTLQRSLQDLSTSISSTWHMVRPADCGEVYHQGNSISGVYEVQPDQYQQTLANVSCMFDESGLWTVIQRRVDGSTDFDRNWTEYRNGFGSPGLNSNHWVGLEHVHRLTAQREYTIRFDVKDWKGNWRYAEYSAFNISDERHHYALYWSDISGKSTAGDALFIRRGRLHEYGMSFSTRDADHDGSPLNCAAVMRGGWWYNWCGLAYLNGKYHDKKERFTTTGIRWASLKHAYSFAETIIRIKPTGPSRTQLN